LKKDATQGTHKSKNFEKGKQGKLRKTTYIKKTNTEAGTNSSLKATHNKLELSL